MLNVFDNMSVQLCKMWCKSNIEDIYSIMIMQFAIIFQYFNV